MFQRFKEASGALSSFVDQLADEQNRLRAQQAGPQSSTRRPNVRSRPSTPSQSKLPRASSDELDKPGNLSGPDPDPATFETDAIAEDKNGVPDDVVTPARASSEGTPPTDKLTGDVVTVEDGKEDITEKAREVAVILPDEVQTKLRKLGKLETKYQDLLKAYRRAHARNSLIEPFEARLRESTPLTSISDPGALIDYLNQLGTKGDMVMQELKKVSGERDELRKMVENTEEKLREAGNEVERLKYLKIEKDVSTISFDAVIEDESSPRSADVDAQDGEEVFSVEAQVPRLEAELQQHRLEIVQLKTENADLIRELEVGKETAEQMMRDMETTKQELETVQALHARLREADAMTRKELEANVNNLTVLLNNSRTDLQQAQTARGHDEASRLHEQQALGHDIDNLQSELEISKAKLLALQDRQTNTESAHRNEVTKLEESVARLTTELQAAEDDARAQGKRFAASEASLRELEMQAGPSPAITKVQTQQDNDASETVGTKKKNKKKNKKKGTSGTPAEIECVDNPSLVAVNGAKLPEVSAVDVALSTLQDRYDECLAQLKEKTSRLEQVEQKIKDQGDLLEEIESLREELLTIGQEHVETKERLASVERERRTLLQRIVELEDELSQSRQNQQENSSGAEDILVTLQSEVDMYKRRAESVEEERVQLQSTVSRLKQDMDEREKAQATTIASTAEAQEKLEIDFEDLKIKSSGLQTNLLAAEQLAATRFKEMTSLRDILQRAQPELTSLRAEVLDMKNIRDELSAKSKELRRLELKEENLKAEVDTARVEISSKEQEVKTLNQKLSQETSQRLGMEETQRKSQRDVQRLQQERTDALSTKDSLSKELEQANKQLEAARSRLEQLGTEVDNLTKDTDNLREEISLKTAQHASAEMLMNSVRDQAAEMAMQLKEAKERCESLEEELTDAHRLMGERGRENETMRRLLADVETRAEIRVKEMRERMELAIQERDRAEEDASSIGRRKTRELEDMKNRLRTLERDLKIAVEDKEQLESAESDLRRHKGESERKLEQSRQEVEDVRKAMGELRDALDEGERQAREFELERTDLRRSLEEIQKQADKLQRTNKTLSDDLRSARATRMRPTDSPAQSTRSSLESSRPAKLTSPTSPRTASFSLGASMSMDYVYLKNVLLQFMEQRDKNHQKQLVPVLGMLLHFDKKDEQKWMTAINGR